MKFGLFFEIQCPKPWDEGSEHRVFHEALEQAVLADKLGFDCVWHAEHHFLEEYSHSSAPELMLAAIAARTKNIRIGHGIKHVTTNHPLRIAEQVGTLDIISNGRLELGLGEGSNTTELHPFEVRFREKREHFEDAVKCFMPMLWNESWSYESERFKVPPRNVLPKPLQKPHPPLWVACSQTETIRQAGAWGMGAMGFAFVDPTGAEAWVHAYYNAFLNHQQPITNYQPQANLTSSYYFLCAPTDELAFERAQGATFFEFSLGYYQKFGPFEAGKTDFWAEYLKWRETDKARIKEAFLREHMMVGSPATLRPRVKKLHDLHVDQVLLIAQTGKTTHEQICESMEIFAREVMPEFHDLDDKHQDWKRKVLSREIVLSDIDTTGRDLRQAEDQSIDQSVKKDPAEKAFAQNL
ncbi:MAG: LuxA [Hydrocarboniphaga sp.]|uniref:LLM class flavin-dependent oxidoreductase n=1 Tax=Hydrocarboniphaga sp. TaxID=2033016 RepID=UPI00262CE636|nr:LLM class flavin-dependent oxidoreductase [Hydrocarboniphaga sp.]MDB5967867.1 LuxA [Hydrocarboniphaga sp.]